LAKFRQNLRVQQETFPVIFCARFVESHEKNEVDWVDDSGNTIDRHPEGKGSQDAEGRSDQRKSL